MMKNPPAPPARLAALVLAALPTHLCAAVFPVSIENPGFEARSFAGAIDPEGGADGWSYYGSDDNSTGLPIFGLWNPTPSDFTLEAPEGSVAAYVFGSPSGTGCSQVLSGGTGIFQANTRYVLTVKVGDPLGIAYDGYIVQLAVDDVVIAQDDNSLVPPDGGFIASTVIYQYNAASHAALTGKPIEIRLLAKGLSDGTGEIDFDDVRLTYESNAAIANPGGPYQVNSSGTLSLNGGASQAAPGAAITAYQWDLNNDGNFGDAAGATPAAISYTVLKNTWGMVDGANTIKLRITDSLGNTSTPTPATVSLFPISNYIGPNANKGSDDWNKPNNWSPAGVPNGARDVVIPAGKSPQAWNGTTPEYTGNLLLNSNASLQIGWTTSSPASYNSMGTPGSTLITMAAGSNINMRMGGTPAIPGILLTGNASVTLGSSTQSGAQAVFDHGINGPYRFSLQGNNQGQCVANLNTANTFSELYAEGGPYVEGGLTIKAAAAGSLGTGNVTIKAAPNGANYAILEINAGNAMADTGTLSTDGNSSVKLRMNADDTIGALVLDGVQQAAGTYGSNSSSATNKVTWIAGTGILTVSEGPARYWDINGTTAGAGGAAPAGTWDATAKWNANSAGTAATSAWPAGNKAIFAAGTDATATYAVTVSGTQSIRGLAFEEGTVTLAGGSLQMSSDAAVSVVSGATATIATPFSNVARQLSKTGAGTLVLSGNNLHTGATVVSAGTLRAGAANVLPDASAIVVAGNAAGVTATLDLNGFSDTIASLTLGGATATSGAAVATGAGTLTLNGNVTFDQIPKPLGATIAGNLALGATTRIFTIGDSPNAANDLSVSAAMSGTGGLTKTGLGGMLLSGNNTYTGATVVNAGTLAFSGSNASATGGITVNSTSVVRFDSPASINGTTRNVTVNSGGTVSFGASFGAGNIPAALLNRITAASAGVIAADNHASTAFDFNTAGLTAAFLGATGDVNYTGVITPNGGTYRLGGGGGVLTLANANAVTGGNTMQIGGSVVLGNSNNLTGNTTILPGGRLQIGTGGSTGSLANSNITNNGILVFNRSDTVTQGSSFTAPINGSGSIEKWGGGTLALPVANNHTGSTTLGSGVLRIGHASAIGTGQLVILGGTLDASSPVTLSTNNPLKLGGNFAFGGTANLNLGSGPIGNNGNRVITLNGTGTTLTLGGVMSNRSNADQTTTVNGGGNTLVLGGYELSDNVVSNTNTITGTGNVTINGPVSNGPLTFFCDLIKEGTGTLTLTANNTHDGGTTVNGGVLAIPSGTQQSDITVNNGGTLALTIGSTIETSGFLILNPGHKIRIIGTPSLASHTLLIADAVLAGAPALEPAFMDSFPNYQLTVDGNELKLTTIPDNIPPTLASQHIVDDQNGNPVAVGTTVNYTVSFNEDIDASTLTEDDFDNAATSLYAVGAIQETGPTTGVFLVQVTPTGPGTLRLRIPAGAVVHDAAGNALATPIEDDTTLTVQKAYDLWAEGEPFDEDANGDGILNGMAWALGVADPDADVLGAGMLPETDNDDPIYFIFSYRRADSAHTAPGTAIAVEYGNGLSGPWTTAVHDGNNIVIETFNNFHGTNPGVDRVDVKIKRSFAGARLFTRLKVVNAP